MAKDIDKIIDAAKQQQKWSMNHKWNYGPIDYLKEHIIEHHNGCTEYDRTTRMFLDNVHKVTDAETYFVYEHSAFDIYVDADLMVCKMRKAFPDVSFTQVVEWLNKHEAPHQYTNGISKCFVPKEYLKDIEN